MRTMAISRAWSSWATLNICAPGDPEDICTVCHLYAQFFQVTNLVNADFEKKLIEC